MFSEYQTYWLKVHINVYLRSVVTTDSNSWRQFSYSTLSLSLDIYRYFLLSSVSCWMKWQNCNVHHSMRTTTRRVGERSAVLSPGTYGRSGHVVLSQSLPAPLYTHPLNHPSTHSLTHLLLQQTNVYNHKLRTFCQIKTANVYCERPIFTDLLSTNSITLSIRSPSVFIPLLRSLSLLSLSFRTNCWVSFGALGVAWIRERIFSWLILHLR